MPDFFFFFWCGGGENNAQHQYLVMFSRPFHTVRLAENWTFSFSAHLFIHLFIYCCSDLPVQNVSDQLVSFPLCYRHPLWPYSFLNFAVYNGLLLLNCAEGLGCAHVLAEFDVGCHCVSVFIYCSNFKDTPVCAVKAFLQLLLFLISPFPYRFNGRLDRF